MPKTIQARLYANKPGAQYVHTDGQRYIVQPNGQQIRVELHEDGKLRRPVKNLSKKDRIRLRKAAKNL